MSDDLEAISAAACMGIIARGEETINPKFAGVVRDLIDRLRMEASFSQARLSEAVKVLKSVIPYADDLSYDTSGSYHADIRTAKAFLATIGEEND